YNGAPYNFTGSRDGAVSRYNFARLLGGSVPGPGNVGFSLPEYYVDEKAGIASFTVQRQNGSLGKVSLTYSTADGTAKAPADYIALANSMATWGDGATNDMIQQVGIIDDGLITGDKTLNLVASMADSDFTLNGLPIPLGVALGRDHATINIAEGDIPPSYLSFGASAYTIDENGGNAVINVTRSGSTAGRITVDYATREQTNGAPAQAGVDYQARNGTLTFDTGQTNKTFSVPIIDDTVVEPDETLMLVLSSPRGNGALLGSISNATLTIVDNDYAPGRITFTATNFSALEDSTNAVITVKRSGGNVGVVSVQYSTADGTGIAGTNYYPAIGRLSWADGDSAAKTFTIPLINNNIVDGNKTVSLILSDFTGALAGSISNATLTIIDDDAFGKLSLSATNYLVDEYAAFVTIVVNRTGGIA
ncbi:MAG: hypothetical protein M1608_10140, partial [Candidatus Omnitrophica bacterium]|nr:hypothetical protein [Candidatus Omnitrophota bacterium]